MPALIVRASLEKPDGSKLRVEEEFYVDTAFTVDLKMPQSTGCRFEGMGIIGSEYGIKTAIGTAKGSIFRAVIDEIILNGTNILATPQQCLILCLGEDDTPNVVGLNALRNFKMCVDLPQQILSIEQQ